MSATDERVEHDLDAVDGVWENWTRAVNMTSVEVERWLLTERSRTVKRGDVLLDGHQPSRRVIMLLNTPKQNLTEADADTMREVVSHIESHMGDRPLGNVLESDWRFGLMHWGHDPLKGPALA